MSTIDNNEKISKYLPNERFLFSRDNFGVYWIYDTKLRHILNASYSANSDALAFINVKGTTTICYISSGHDVFISFDELLIHLPKLNKKLIDHIRNNMSINKKMASKSKKVIVSKEPLWKIEEYQSFVVVNSKTGDKYSFTTKKAAEDRLEELMIQEKTGYRLDTIRDILDAAKKV